MIKDQIDNLRAWAIIGVVIIHVTSYFTNVTEISYLPIALASLDIYAHFAVPLFVLISGFVLGLNYTGNFNKSDFFKKRIHRILIPYLIWSAVYISHRHIKVFAIFYLSC
jgi:probable poly-beta-1,6-N-acetyl-D-glucosamine export protein